MKKTILSAGSRPPYIPRPLMIRFVEFCASNRLASVRVAWQTFSTRKPNATDTSGMKL